MRFSVALLALAGLATALHLIDNANADGVADLGTLPEDGEELVEKRGIQPPQPGDPPPLRSPDDNGGGPPPPPPPPPKRGIKPPEPGDDGSHSKRGDPPSQYADDTDPDTIPDQAAIDKLFKSRIYGAELVAGGSLIARNHRPGAK
ncbi:hypothetical protein JDV02_008282 [Purpureocillium takamizusanense]|uniref:Uncharacterized protein n=1 Tax=Purpureocillium takamizusanense TaxID=2060973 RepID=A0A9Q8QME0_9HYPO|nr:uncharacterized protein JDV02_008282 [Purpureocillium takamizusanense]UNI22390.1 hypothetical protein JDV02_008282 [Purpureocillium takamizusanense]